MMRLRTAAGSHDAFKDHGGAAAPTRRGFKDRVDYDDAVKTWHG